MAEVIRMLIDPNTAPLRRPPRNDHDLMIAANKGWICVFDNLSYINPEMSDALCCLSSGGGIATRKLYSDDEEAILFAERPIILNGIEDMAIRSDLLDRCLILDLPRIDPAHRRDEEGFWKEFKAAQPRIFGALLNAASAALRNLPAVKRWKASWPRMADLAQWVSAASPALNMKWKTFLDAYEANRAAANQTALESSPVVAALQGLIVEFDGKIEGTATELLAKLSVGQDTRAKSWPKNPRALSGILNRLAPNLRATGMTIDQEGKVWRISRPLTAEELAAKAQISQIVAENPVPMSDVMRTFAEEARRSQAQNRP